MKHLLIYLKDYKKETILAPLFKMLEASFELLVPFIMADIIDTGIKNNDVPYILYRGGLLLALALIGLLCSVTAQYFAAKASVGFAKKLRHNLFAHIQDFSFTQLDILGSSTIITRMTSDINQVQSGVNLVLRLFLRSPFIVIGAMIMAFTIDVKGALIFAVAIPLLSIVIFGIMLYTMPLYKKVQEKLDRILRITRENLSGVRVLRAFHKEEQQMNQFKSNNDSLTRLLKRVGRISSFMNPITFVIVNVSIIALLYTGALRVDSGYLTQGEVIALVNFMSQILVELIKLANLIISISKALACANRIDALFLQPTQKEEQQELQVVNSSSKPLLSFQNVSLTYENSAAPSLKNINFDVMPGHNIGIIGGTGSGKTSLVSLIPKFYNVTSGTILYHGQSLSSYPIAQVRKKIGFVMQKAVLFSGSIRDNLLWGNPKASDEELWNALQIAQAKEFVSTKKEGLDFVLTQGGKNLSGGQKQRLTIARALVKQPEILILDDSASALDYATENKLRQAIANLKGQMTTFIVSQRASSIRHCDLIIVMEDGEIAGTGTHEQLLSSCAIYREIYESQFTKEEA